MQDSSANITKEPRTLTAALDYARRGWKVFPLNPTGKKPIRDLAWKEEATTDEAQIRKWWSENPNYNIGILTGASSKLLVFDADKKDGKDGEAIFAKMVPEYGIEPTYTVETPNGFHYYCEHPGVSIVGAVSWRKEVWGEGLDIRCDGNYVVGATSVFNGREYHVTNDATVAKIPPALVEILPKHDRPRESQAANAHQFGEKIPKGERNATLISKAGSMRRAGFSEDAIEAALQVFNEERCDPPLAAREVTTIAHSAARYEPGEPAKPTKEEKRSEFKFKTFAEVIAGVSAPQWLIEDYLPQNSLIVEFGDPETGKSLIVVDQGLCVASGAPWHGHAVKQGAVFYIVGEGYEGLARRYEAWKRINDITDDSFNPPFFTSETEANLTDADSAEEVADAIRELVEQTGQEPALIIVDTLARNFGAANENDNSMMSAFAGNVDRIRRRYDATAIVVHHTGHNNTHRGRGGKALLGALDVEYRDSRDETGVIRRECTKPKDIERPPPLVFHVKPMDLGKVDGRGKPVTGPALEMIEYTEPVAVNGGTRKLGKAEKLALDVLGELFARGRANLIDDDRDPDAVLVETRHWRSACVEAEIDRGHFYRLKDNLVRKGLVVEGSGFVSIKGF